MTREKVYGVFWREASAKEYGVPKNEMLYTAGIEGETKVKVTNAKKGERKWYWTPVLVIFKQKREAIAWIGGNSDFVVMPIILTF